MSLGWWRLTGLEIFPGGDSLEEEIVEESNSVLTAGRKYKRCA
jgi:hypothetical protein